MMEVKVSPGSVQTSRLNYHRFLELISLKITRVKKRDFLLCYNDK